MPLVILFHFLCTQHVSDINIPSSGACNCAVELPHRSFRSRFAVCWRFGAAVFERCPCCRLQVHKKWNKKCKWHQVGLLFFNYYNDARSNRHRFPKVLIGNWLQPVLFSTAVNRWYLVSTDYHVSQNLRIVLKGQEFWNIVCVECL